MNNIEFVRRAREACEKYKTLYVTGCFGAPMTERMKARYIAGHAYNKEHAAQINAASADTFGFDCVCFIKGILWGWSGDADALYGGAAYASNGVPDIGTEGMIAACTEVSEDFSRIAVGELLWMKGHVGIYIGDGLAVEATSAWESKVQITAVHNMGKRDGYNGRTWVKHGKLPYVEYVEEKPEQPEQMILRLGDTGAAVMSVQVLLAARGYFKPDGVYDAVTAEAVRAFQRDTGLKETGEVDQGTLNALYGKEYV